MMHRSFVGPSATKPGGETRISHRMVAGRARIMMQLAEKGLMPHGALNA